MRVLLIGATGLLGRALVEEWRSDEVVGASSKDADIRDPKSVNDLLSRRRPDWTILAAAYTDVDGCERNPALAHQINCLGAENVARAARDCGSRLLYLSTDYVFDGTAASPYEVDAPVSPISIYGRSKAAGEAAVRSVLEDCCIVRTAWLYGTRGDCFPEKILRLLETQREFSIPADQYGSPTFNRDLARAIIQLVHRGARGIVHATNSGSCSRFEFAEEILRAAGIENVLLRPITTDEALRPARRPKYSVLSAASLRGWGISLRPWRGALLAYMDERMGVPRSAVRAALQ